MTGFGDLNLENSNDSGYFDVCEHFKCNAQLS